MKKYEVGSKTLSQGELSLNDGKKMLKLLKGIDFNSLIEDKQTLYEAISNYLDQNILEQLFDIILKGERPEGDIGDWMSASLAGQVVVDFLELNKPLMKSAESLLIGSRLSQKVETAQKSTD